MEDESRTHQSSEETMMSGAGRLQSLKNSLVLISCCCRPASMFYCSSSKYMLLNQRLHINESDQTRQHGGILVRMFLGCS